MKVSIAVTSANNIKLTENCLKSIPENYFTIVYDDGSTEPVKEMCEKLGISFVGMDQPKGCTNLWNTAFNDFLKTDNDILMITNNDVLFPKGSIEQMVIAFSREKPVMLGPLSNRPGACPDGGQYQDIRMYLPQGIAMNADDSRNIQVLQNGLLTRVEKVKVDKYLCGFCFMVDKRIWKYRYDDSHLIPPYIINVGNETWLCARIVKENGISKLDGQVGPRLIGDELMICCTSFVFHFQGMTTRWCAGKEPNLKSHKPHDSRESLWRK